MDYVHIRLVAIKFWNKNSLGNKIVFTSSESRGAPVTKTAKAEAPDEVEVLKEENKRLKEENEVLRGELEDSKEWESRLLAQLLDTQAHYYKGF